MARISSINGSVDAFAASSAEASVVLSSAPFESVPLEHATMQLTTTTTTNMLRILIA
jgi:hypothetical protein